MTPGVGYGVEGEGMMENTRKLQFAAELLEEVEEDTDTAKVEVECKAMRGTISELRHLCLQERVEKTIQEKEAAD